MVEPIYKERLLVKDQLETNYVKLLTATDTQ